MKLNRKSLNLKRTSIKWNRVFYHVGKFLSKRIQLKCNFQIPSKPIPLFERTPMEANKIFASYQILSIFTFSSHTEYVKRESIVIAWVKKKKNSLRLTNFHVLYVLEDKTSKKNFRLFVCLSGWLAAHTWTFHVDTITFEGVSESKQNLLGVFYVWNVGLVLKSKVILWSWSWSWTEFWFTQKLCGATPNLVDIFKIYRITFSSEFHSEILILLMILILFLKKKNSEKSLRNKTKFHEYH